ncbi:MAG: CRISPR-associated endonuclease Cas3'' [Acidimicrobiia bacterium]
MQTFHSSDFSELVRAATGRDPYPFQARLAAEGLPELLRAPTGSGKTLAAALPWLYRRRFHSDASVRNETPHWLVYVLPMRVLVEQTAAAIRGWVQRLGLGDELAVHVVMGGEGRVDSTWRMEPTHEAVFVGTLDMLLSRALNRGYGESRFAWPIDFGLFNNGCHWVFDEIQLMGAALPTSRQLEGLRDAIGTAIPCRSTWMSATVPEQALVTFDRPGLRSVVDIGDADRTGGLAKRLNARKTVRRVKLPTASKLRNSVLAEQLLGAHRPATLTIAVCNTVDGARSLHRAIERARPRNLDLVLLHSRFRPGDRAARVEEALAPLGPGSAGRIVVSTQVLEAGVDISAATMFTEAASWPSIVQRAGRCNRDGEASDAQLLWAPPKKPFPYDPADIAATVAALDALEGAPVTSVDLGGRAVATTTPVHPVLRRRDLVGLFDTAPDLSGNDLDVGRFLRDADDLDVLVAWREIPTDGLAPDVSPGRDELCPVTASSFQAYLKGSGNKGFRFDHLRGEWVNAVADDVRPGMIAVLSAASGGYRSETGWDPSSRERVEPVVAVEAPGIDTTSEAAGDDPVSYATRSWVGLREHLADVERATSELIAAAATPGLSDVQRAAAVAAARLHDIGKAHEVFQDTMRRSASDGETVPEALAPFAKSGGAKRPKHSRRFFRHELASALALLGEAGVALERIEERDLVVYLVAAHHGRVRMSIRSLPDETTATEGPGVAVALGIHQGDRLPSVEVPGEVLPESTLDLSVMALGDGLGGRRSWSRRALDLRDRADLGIFRLGYLEAMARLGDWRASAIRREVSR